MMKNTIAQNVEPGSVEMASGYMMNTSPGPAHTNTHPHTHKHTPMHTQTHTHIRENTQKQMYIFVNVQPFFPEHKKTPSWQMFSQLDALYNFTGRTAQ